MAACRPKLKIQVMKTDLMRTDEDFIMTAEGKYGLMRKDVKRIFPARRYSSVPNTDSTA